MATTPEALAKLYNCMNHPRSAGPSWVKYTREQADAMLEVVRDLAILHGCTITDDPPIDINAPMCQKCFKKEATMQEDDGTCVCSDCYDS